MFMHIYQNCVLLIFLCIANAKKKDITDYNEADMERLYDEWERAEEEQIPIDELPPSHKPPVQLDISKFNMSDPEAILRHSKKGRTVMMFVTVSGKPSRKNAETIVNIWHSQLFNHHYDVTQYMIEDDRAIFVFQDGEQAWEAKDFLILQERCESINLESEIYYGKGSDKYVPSKTAQTRENKGVNKKEKKKNAHIDKSVKKNEEEIKHEL